jgi:hypothetical protein
MNIKFQFEEFKAGLKEKWLDYYEANRHWIERVVNKGFCSRNTSEGRCPSHEFTLAVITALEPSLKELLPCFTELNSNPECLMKALGLDFNPERELAIRAEIKNRIQAIETIPLLPESDTEYLNKIRQENIT